MNTVILLLGGNLGERIKLIKEAKFLLTQENYKITLQSSLYESEPWGFKHAQNFINQVIEIETDTDVESLLNTTQKIEKCLGRKAKIKEGYEGRTMDIDILFFNDDILESTNLTVPHPKLHQRKFTLLPLNELWPDLKHPVLKKSIENLLEICEDKGWVKKIS